MYLHLGQDKVVATQEIVGIFDLDTSTVSKATRDYLARAEKEKRVINICSDLPKSFIVCGRRKEERLIYISQISSATLLKRSTFIESLTNVK